MKKKIGSFGNRKRWCGVSYTRIISRTRQHSITISVEIKVCNYFFKKNVLFLIFIVWI